MALEKMINKCNIIHFHKYNYLIKKYEYTCNYYNDEYTRSNCEYDQHDLLIKNGYKLINNSNNFNNIIYFKNIDINKIIIKIHISNSTLYNYCNRNSYPYKYCNCHSSIIFYNNENKCIHKIHKPIAIDSIFIDKNVISKEKLLLEVLNEKQLKEIHEHEKYLKNIMICCYYYDLYKDINHSNTNEIMYTLEFKIKKR